MTRREQIRRQQRREDAAVTALIWALIFGIVGVTGAMWYVVITFMNKMDVLAYCFTGPM